MKLNWRALYAKLQPSKIKAVINIEFFTLAGGSDENKINFKLTQEFQTNKKMSFRKLQQEQNIFMLITKVY